MEPNERKPLPVAGFTQEPPPPRRSRAPIVIGGAVAFLVFAFLIMALFENWLDNA